MYRGCGPAAHSRRVYPSCAGCYKLWHDRCLSRQRSQGDTGCTRAPRCTPSPRAGGSSPRPRSCRRLRRRPSIRDAGSRSGTSRAPRPVQAASRACSAPATRLVPAVHLRDRDEHVRPAAPLPASRSSRCSSSTVGARGRSLPPVAVDDRRRGRRVPREPDRGGGAAGGDERRDARAGAERPRVRRQRPEPARTGQPQPALEAVLLPAATLPPQRGQARHAALAPPRRLVDQVTGRSSGRSGRPSGSARRTRRSRHRGGAGRGRPAGARRSRSRAPRSRRARRSARR